MFFQVDSVLVVCPAVIFIPGDLAAWDDSVWNESAWNVCRDGSMDLQHDGESALSYRAYRKSYQYIRKKNIQSFYISRMHSVEIWCIGQRRRFITVGAPQVLSLCVGVREQMCN